MPRLAAPVLCLMLAVSLTLTLAGCFGHRTRASSGRYDPQEQVEMLKELRDKGLITDAEFEEKKARVLKRK